jgi:hypothetical protein
LVQRIVRAYEDHKGRNEQLSLSLDIRTGNGFAAPRASNGNGVAPSIQQEIPLAQVPPVAESGTGNRISE